MSALFDMIKRAATRANLSYCDYIADRIRHGLITQDKESLLSSVGLVVWDLHPTEGYFLSTTKRIDVEDRNGTRYRITVEQVSP